jgi:CheY-like chemotaxis protein
MHVVPMPLSDTIRNAQILVVSQSKVNLAVIVDIIKRSGLRCDPALLSDAERLLKAKRPDLVLIDGGPENADMHALSAAIGNLKRSSDGKPMRVLLLSSQSGTPQSIGTPSIVDEVVAKPITLDTLQPALRRALRAGN